MRDLLFCVFVFVFDSDWKLVLHATLTVGGDFDANSYIARAQICHRVSLLLLYPPPLKGPLAPGPIVKNCTVGCPVKIPTSGCWDHFGVHIKHKSARMGSVDLCVRREYWGTGGDGGIYIIYNVYIYIHF